MRLLAALTRAYERLPDKPDYGYSLEKIGFCVVLNGDGTVADVVDLRADDKKRSPRHLVVPACPKRSGSTPRPNFMWDNANYALGMGKLNDPDDSRHDAFCEKHLQYLSDAESVELQAFCSFLKTWKPEDCKTYFDIERPPTEGIVFAHVDSYRDMMLHEAAQARDLWVKQRSQWISVPGKDTERAICLVTGEYSSIERTHPPIKGVWGGKTEMALISFNSEAYESYGHEQGDNAPVSEAAAFAYTTALNRFLADKDHRLQIGDASTVFWADAGDGDAAEQVETLFQGFFELPFDPEAEDKVATGRVAEKLQAIRKGERLPSIAPDLQGVRFYVLGLSPNAARLSVRFWWESDFGTLTAHYQRYLADMALEPPPRDGWPPLWRFLTELAPMGKRENIPPLIAGEWMRAILTGGRYPLTLLSTVLMRLRADGDVNPLRVAILKSVLTRNLKLEVPVALDPANTNKGYVLGRLFAVYEEVQRAALGGHVNATIRDKFYGAASASPQKVFRALDSGSQNHFSKLRKQSPGRAVNLEKLLGSIADLMNPGDDPIPASLNAAEQSLFGIGYYHQRSDFFRKHDDNPEVTE